MVKRIRNTEQSAPETGAEPKPAGGVAVTAIERVLDIFEAFQRMRKPLSLTDLSEMTGIPKSSCHAIVHTLTARGYLYTLTRPRAIYPTRRLYDMASEIQANDPFIEHILPMLERLRDASRETVILGKRQGDAVIYLQVAEGLHTIRYSAKPGEFKPLHSSSIGKALLGSLKEVELRAQLAERDFPAITETTITDTQALITDIQDSRRKGYFITRGENVPDVWAISAFLNIQFQTFGIAIAGPRHRMEKTQDECAKLLVSACSLI
ncbi:IclR family transcriptional regulator [Diaphorobacter sp. HDW4A]|uniref:IclR family transcriptional regulator n=1 Tax=Diaphorobacter sp. HDW4A TaxID=2714924 RepID=UPI001409FCA7|nr:IclR family transcriptional regulator [Diaphorobacter sp. HDW4A]QIL79979.1 IclR family transcriptional regulator [Diaphorobacter sp. HDW4A]